MPFPSKTMLLAGAVGALAMIGAAEAQAGYRHMLLGPVGPPLGATDPTMAYPLSEDAADALEDAQDAANDAANDAAVAAAAVAAMAAAARAHEMIEDALDD